ncbi:hypothetical protein B0T17DRAFT_614640 [Bombardia bombarda]|uniref:Uncharacterized protein n=1 Tax=Bombardia bombarda TaxID=252184 RepID=A0AA39X7J0_9PEZI|nr:hypothetical protein B0T17DRAFT_614640 [Bombardia bombarda]
MNLKFSLSLITLLLAVGGLAQTTQPTECTRELARSDDCADVINPNACYNQFRWTSSRTLQCIDGKDQADRARKACKCCSCVGTVMCDWVKTNKLCAAH